MDITRTPGMKLELWVQDKGVFDGFAVYFDGSKIATVADQGVHAFPLTSTNPLSIVVLFRGNDGGMSAIVDNQNKTDQSIITKQDGIRHAYIVR